MNILPNKLTNKGNIAFTMATIDAIIVVIAIFMIVRLFLNTFSYYIF